MKGSLGVSLEHGKVPPSYNAYQRASWQKQARLKREWENLMAQLLMVSRVARGPWDYVEASVTLRFPTRRRRDEGNYKTPIEKALGDALVNGGWLPDDTGDHFRVTTVQIEDEPGPERMRLELAFVPKG